MLSRGLVLAFFLLAATFNNVSAQSTSACTVCSCRGSTVDCSWLQITAVPTDIPATTTVLNLGYTTLQSIASSDLAGLTDLTRIDLSGTSIYQFPVNLFENNRNLKEVIMRDMGALQTWTDIFSYTPSIELWSFSGARTLILPTTVFANARTLKTLIVEDSYRGSRTFPSGWLAGLTRLQTLAIINYRTVTTLGADLLTAQTDLRVLNLTDLTAVTSIDSNLLASNPNLEFLSMRNTFVRASTIPATLFSHQTKLQTLILSEGALVSVDKDAFNATTALTTLMLHNNRISALNENIFAALTNLQTLTLTSNQLATISPNLFRAMSSSLRSLDINSNKLAATSLDFVQGLTALESLSLMFNQITAAVSATHFAGMTRLRTLALTDSRLASIAPTAFSSLTALETLDLSGTQFGTLPQVFATLTQLKTLQLLSCNILTIVGGTFSSLTRLTDLGLTDNGLTALSEATLVGLANLDSLYMGVNKLTTLPINFGFLLPRLTYLNLDSNLITNLAASTFQSMTLIRQIVMPSNQLATLPPTIFNGLTTLTTLNLRANGLTAVPDSLFQGLLALRTLNLGGSNLGGLSTRAFTLLPNLVALNLSQSNIAFVLKGTLHSVVQQLTSTSADIALDMTANGVACAYSAAAGTVYATLTCNCSLATRGDGKYCAPVEQIKCLAGTTDADNDAATPCVTCPAGTYTPENWKAACAPCPAGTTDSDSDPATPCVPCSQPGLHVPAGSTGSCADMTFSCAAQGKFDHDSNSATPCVDVCSFCTCTDKNVVDCRSRNISVLPTLPANFAVRTLMLDNNTITTLPASLFEITLLKEVYARSNLISSLPSSLMARITARNMVFTTSDNPSECYLNMDAATNNPTLQAPGCFCAKGFAGNGFFCEQAQVTEQQRCPAGFVDHDSEAATPCVQCPQTGFHVPAGSFGPCQLFICPAGTTDHDMDASTPCQTCSAGAFAPAGSVGTCASLACAAGTRDHDADLRTPCQPCNAGTYVPANSIGACSGFNCSAGTFDHDSNPSTPCHVCPRGSYSTAGQVDACYTCDAGSIDDDLNAVTPCVPLTQGSYAAAGSYGSAAIFQCAAGSSDADYDPRTPCVSCPSGGYVPLGSSGACDTFACTNNTFDHDNDASTPCVPVELQVAVDSSSGGNKVGVAVGVTAACVAVVALVLLLVVRRRYQNIIKAHDFEDELRALPMSGKVKMVPREVDRRKLHMLGTLGKGAFGVVNKALLNEPTSLGLPAFLVAVKQFDDPSGKEKEQIFREAALMAQVSSEFVLKLVGVITKDIPLFIILEFCEHGSLDTFLTKHGKNLLLNSRLQLAHDIAAGMEALESIGFLHRDLAARNVLVASNLRAKIADFGHARDLQDSSEYTASDKQAFALRWTAPEAFEQRVFTHRTDTWSYGVTLWEIFSNGDRPYSTLSNSEVWLAVSGGQRLAKPAACPNRIYDMMLSCWAKDPKQRPDFSSLRSYFIYELDGDVQALERNLDTISQAAKSKDKSNTLSTTTSSCSSGSAYMSMDSATASISSATVGYMSFNSKDSTSGVIKHNPDGSAFTPQPFNPKTKDLGEPAAAPAPTYTNLATVMEVDEKAKPMDRINGYVDLPKMNQAGTDCEHRASTSSYTALDIDPAVKPTCNVDSDEKGYMPLIEVVMPSSVTLKKNIEYSGFPAAQTSTAKPGVKLAGFQTVKTPENNYVDEKGVEFYIAQTDEDIFHSVI
eukprot:m.202754 g.202754  ORF g.202754 m.202754 type:complete len:1714 (+) comp17724_c0_seq5:316-5457(+)